MTNIKQSDILKYFIMTKYRFDKTCSLIATETGQYNADVLVIDNTFSVIEFEVKTDYYDLINDFKKDKHGDYLNCQELFKRRKYRPDVPNLFYFVIPDDFKIIEKCKELVVKNNPKYGIIVCKIKKDIVDIRVLKRAVKLHSEKVTNELRRKILLRMGSMMLNLYKKVFIKE